MRILYACQAILIGISFVAGCSTSQLGRSSNSSLAGARSRPLFRSSVSSSNRDERGSQPVKVDPRLAKRFAFLRDASPKADLTIIAGLERVGDPLGASGIEDNDERLLQFLAECAVETFGFRTLSENLDYSAATLLRVFPNRVSVAEATLLAHRPVDIANFVYGSRFGNRLGTNDGWNFRGAGYLQLTFRDNFVEIGKSLGLRVDEYPASVRDPRLGLDAALAFWKSRNINSIADGGDVSLVRKAVNGGDNGLDAAKIWLAVLRKALLASKPVTLETSRHSSAQLDRAVVGALSDLGFYNRPILEGGDVTLNYSEALKAFQISRGLPPSGKFDVRTLYAITDPLGRFSSVN